MPLDPSLELAIVEDYIAALKRMTSPKEPGGTAIREHLAPCSQPFRQCGRTRRD